MSNNKNNNKNILKNLKDSNNDYKQIFANPMKNYSNKEQKAINVYLKNLQKKKRN